MKYTNSFWNRIQQSSYWVPLNFTEMRFSSVRYSITFSPSDFIFIVLRWCVIHVSGSDFASIPYNVSGYDIPKSLNHVFGGFNDYIKKCDIGTHTNPIKNRVPVDKSSHCNQFVVQVTIGNHRFYLRAPTIQMSCSEVTHMRQGAHHQGEIREIMENVKKISLIWKNHGIPFAGKYHGKVMEIQILEKKIFMDLSFNICITI